ncbi:MAG: hypothetical protein ABIR98_12950 [Usitatibacter sp.]
MQPTNSLRKADDIRHALLDLHKSMIDAQRIIYERDHGRVETPAQFLGLVLEHPDFEWIRELSALMALLDEWREDSKDVESLALDDIVGALRTLIQRDSTDVRFTDRYWRMLDSTPEVLVGHVKLWRMLGADGLNSRDGKPDPRTAG